MQSREPGLGSPAKVQTCRQQPSPRAYLPRNARPCSRLSRRSCRQCRSRGLRRKDRCTDSRARRTLRLSSRCSTGTSLWSTVHSHCTARGRRLQGAKTEHQVRGARARGTVSLPRQSPLGISARPVLLWAEDLGHRLGRAIFK